VSRDGGATWSAEGSVTTTASASASHVWTVTGPAATRGRVRAKWDADPSTSDASDVDFSITGPAVTVTSPNGSGSLLIGNTQTIRFTHNLGVGQSVKLELSRDGGTTWEHPIAVVTTTSATSGSYAWVVAGPATTLARIRASSAADPDVFDISDVNFSIRPGAK